MAELLRGVVAARSVACATMCGEAGELKAAALWRSLAEKEGSGVRGLRYCCSAAGEAGKCGKLGCRQGRRVVQ